MTIGRRLEALLGACLVGLGIYSAVVGNWDRALWLGVVGGAIAISVYLAFHREGAPAPTGTQLRRYAVGWAAVAVLLAGIGLFGLLGLLPEKGSSRILFGLMAIGAAMGASYVSLAVLKASRESGRRSRR
jgi:hypothetical protein